MGTVKVRIAVAVDYTGNWNAVGYPVKSDTNNDLMSWAIEPLETGESRYWITTELEVPEEAKEIKKFKVTGGRK